MMGRHRSTMRAGTMVLVLVGWVGGSLAAGCTEVGVKAGSGPHYELNFIDMGDQPKIKAQRGNLVGGAAFLPARGAIPRGFDPYPFRGHPELAEQGLHNPLPAGDPKVLERGKLMYERYCVPCHDANGGGEGKVPEKGFPKPPSLMTQKLRDWKDGRIYHVISEGQNIMPSYAAQILPRDRWAAIRYVRQLQSTHPVAPPAATPPAPTAAPPGSAVSPPSSAPVPTDSTAAPPLPASASAPASSGSAAPALPAPATSAATSAAPALPETRPAPPPSPGVPSRDDEVP